VAPSPGPWEAERVRFSAGSAALVVAALAGTLLVRNVFQAAHQPLGWAVAALTGALVLSAVTDLYGRFVRHGIAVVLSLLTVAGTTAVLLLGLVPELQRETDRLTEVLPDAAADLERHERFGSVARDLDLAARVDDAVADLDDRISGRAALEGAVGTAPSFALTGILTVFFLLWGERMAAAARRQISDDRQREQLSAVAARALTRGRAYIAAAVAQGIVIGCLTGAIAWWLDLPAPIGLGLCVGLLSLVPYLGVLLGSIPLLLLAAASEAGWRTALLVALVVALQVASIALARYAIHLRTVRVGPAVIVVTALVGFEVYGFGGVAVALALAVFAVAALDAWAAEERPEPAAPSVPGA
jgi:predicted PurR-regulated permease PerM